MPLMPWKLIDAVMVGLCVAALVGLLPGWPAGFPWFPLVLLAWSITRIRREVQHGPGPYSTPGENFRGR